MKVLYFVLQYSCLLIFQLSKHQYAESSIIDLLLYNFCLQMSIRKIIGMENGVEDFRLEVAPRSIVIPKNSKGFRLYLQKGKVGFSSGMQIIGKFENDPNIPLKDSFYRFRNAHPVQFRVTNLNHSSYTWSLYLVNPETMEETFAETSPFNVERTIKLYQMQLLDKERQIQTSFREKTITKALVVQLWNKVKKEMKTYKSILKCVFSNQDYQIQFHVEIKNALDYEAEKIMMQKQQRSLRRQKSDDFSSLNGSDLKGKQQSNSQVKERYSEKANFIQIQYSPFRSNQQKGDEINTKQTIELQPDTYTNHINGNQQAEDKQNEDVQIENFNATVKIVAPTGEQIDERRHQQGQNEGKRSYSDSSNGSNHQYPMKKFSLLSDIIEMTYEESSSYGHPDQSSSNGFHGMGFRKDRTMDYFNETEMPKETHGLNKFKTLPSQSHHIHRLQVRNGFRRALTSDKNQNDFQTTSQLQEQSYISVNEDKKSKLTQKPKPSSGDPYGKWIILVAVLIIISVISGVLLGQDNARNPPKKRPIKK